MLRLFKGLKPYAVSIAIVCTAVFLQVMSELYLPNLNAQIINTGVITGDMNYIIRTGAIMLVIAMAAGGCAVTASFFSSQVAMGFATALREQVFTKVESFSQAEFEKFGASSLITRTTNDITQIQNVTMMMLRMMLSAPIMCVGGIIMIVGKDAKMVMILLFVIPAILLVVAVLMSKGLPLFKVIQVKIDKLNQVVRENLNGIRVIRAFDRNAHEKKRFDAANLDLMETSLKVNRIMSIMMPALMLIMSLTNVAIMYFGAQRIDQGYMQVGDLTAFITYMMLILMSIMMASMLFVMIPRAQASAVRVNEILDTKPTIVNPVMPQKPTHKKGYVEFRNVSFSYPGAQENVLSDINFSVSPGETTAIIGSTGSGKSTVISLIPRFYDVTQGEILVDGIDIRQINQQDLRAKIGYIPQKAFLFSGTIEDNLRYGKEDATQEEMLHALEIAQGKDFVMAMENGIKSHISQGATNVSGGQKQRLAIARALIKKPEIYIFDDSFSALDLKTDAKLRQALKPETINATVLIVAQRVSSIMHADRIIVLDEGKIVGIGTHKQLLENCEVYREIAASQLTKEEM